MVCHDRVFLIRVQVICDTGLTDQTSFLRLRFMLYMAWQHMAVGRRWADNGHWWLPLAHLQPAAVCYFIEIRSYGVRTNCGIRRDQMEDRLIRSAFHVPSWWCPLYHSYVRIRLISGVWDIVARTSRVSPTSSVYQRTRLSIYYKCLFSCAFSWWIITDITLIL